MEVKPQETMSLFLDLFGTSQFQESHLFSHTSEYKAQGKDLVKQNEQKQQNSLARVDSQLKKVQHPGQQPRDSKQQKDVLNADDFQAASEKVKKRKTRKANEDASHIPLHESREAGENVNLGRNRSPDTVPILEAKRNKRNRQEDIQDNKENDQQKVAKHTESSEDPDLVSSDRKPSKAEDEAAKRQRTAFVGNVPASMARKELKKLFSKFGAVESVRLRSVPLLPGEKVPRKWAARGKHIDAERTPAVAYVVFEDVQGKEAAISGGNMMEVQGHHLLVNSSAPPSHEGKGGAGVSYDPRRSVFVGNLHFALQTEELIKFFEEEVDGGEDLESSVESVRIVRDRRTNIGKGFGYVLFKTKAAARLALSLDGRELKGRPLRVSRVTPHDSSNTTRGTYSKGALSVGGAHASAIPWQGLRTKGSEKKGVRGPKAAAQSTSLHSSGVPPVGVKAARTVKRPAVAARKARLLAGKQQGRATATAQQSRKRTADGKKRRAKPRA